MPEPLLMTKVSLPIVRHRLVRRNKLQRPADTPGQTALEVVEHTQQLDLQRILGFLIKDLYALDQPIVLVLEDYHLIENQDIDQFIELVLNQAIANLHLVITTREEPDLITAE